MKRLIFYFAIVFFLLYLILDVTIIADGQTERPYVQISAGISLFFMILYVLNYLSTTAILIKKMSFLFYWGMFVLLLLSYYALSFIEFPTGYANNITRNAVVLIFIYVAILFTYIGTIKLHLSGKVLSLLILILLFNGLFEIYNEFQMPRYRARAGIEEINTSAGYIFVMVLPLLMYRYRKETLWVYLLTLVLTILTGKRGAMVVCGVVGLFLFWNFKFLSRYSRLTWRKFLIICFALVGIFFFYEYAQGSFLFRMETVIKEDGTIASGRDLIWGTLFAHWLESPIAYKLFGNGFYSSINIMGFIAHNDFIQFLIDYGIIGLFSWIFVNLTFYKQIKSFKVQNRLIYILLMVCLLTLLGRGIIAGTIRTDQIYLSVSIGYLLGVAVLESRM